MLKPCIFFHRFRVRGSQDLYHPWKLWTLAQFVCQRCLSNSCPVALQSMSKRYVKVCEKSSPIFPCLCPMSMLPTSHGSLCICLSLCRPIIHGLRTVRCAERRLLTEEIFGQTSQKMLCMAIRFFPKVQYLAEVLDTNMFLSFLPIHRSDLGREQVTFPNMRLGTLTFPPQLTIAEINLEDDKTTSIPCISKNVCWVMEWKL